MNGRINWDRMTPYMVLILMLIGYLVDRNIFGEQSKLDTLVKEIKTEFNQKIKTNADNIMDEKIIGVQFRTKIVTMLNNLMEDVREIKDDVKKKNRR